MICKQTPNDNRDAFMDEKLVLGADDEWHVLPTCLWGSPFALANFQNLPAMYSDFEGFFVRHLRVKRAKTSMLIDEVRRMAGKASTNIDDIRARLIEVGMMLARTPIDSSITRALEALKEVAFLPKQLSDGTLILVKVTDEFAIPDHARYGGNFRKYSVLLDLQINDVQMHTVFDYFDVTSRYLSTMVDEVSTVAADSTEHNGLSAALQATAYVFFW